MYIMYCNTIVQVSNVLYMLSKEGTTQGDPLAMAMYAIGTQPLIRRLDGHAKQVWYDWYADDSSAGSSIERLKAWGTS